jgi:intein/homing endonuclease
MKKIIKKAPAIQAVAKVAGQIKVSAPISRVRKPVDVSELIPTPSTTFNLECSGHVEGAFKRGTVVNIIGDSHAGKCVKNSYILTTNGMEKIDDIGDDRKIGITPYIEKLSTSKGIEDITSHFWKEEVSKTIKVITRHGYCIEGTEDHPIMVFNENFEFEMRKLKDISEGDCAIIARGTQRFSSNFPVIPLIDLPAANGRIANLPVVITESFARLLGYIVADGNFSNNCICISTTKKAAVDDINSICESLGVNFSGNKSITSKHLTDTIFEMFGGPLFFTARYKFVPKCILESTKEIQANFLQALIDCDSWGDNRQIGYSTASKELAKQVHLMLLNFGIISSLQPKYGAFDGVNHHDNTYWTVCIYGNELNIYRDNIGSKKYNIPVKSLYRNSDYDSVPNLVQKIKGDIEELRKKVGWNKNGTCRSFGCVFPRIKFASAVNGSKKLVEKFVSLFDGMPIDLSLYKFILKSGYHFDPITSIEVDTSTSVVYDVHIPDSHLFWSNGFISHNTLFCLSIFAECSLLPSFDTYRMIFDDVETANEFDIAYLFGQRCEDRIETDVISKTIEELGDNISRALKRPEPFIYVVDSADALTSEAAVKLAEENLIKREKGSKTDGSYGDGKARAFSDLFKRHTQALAAHGSTLIIISQTRDNIGFGAQFNPKVRSCGKALKFYSSHEIWLAMQKKEKKGDRTYITNVQAKVSKNKLTGRHGNAYFPILFDFGIDDITSCIGFLIKEKTWSGDLKGIATNGFHPDEKVSYQKLVKFIEDNCLEQDLKEVCKECYDGIMESMIPSHRKFRYAM